MRYYFTIDINTAINFATKSAEFYVSDGFPENKIVVPQKHIGRYNTIEEAQQAAENYCSELHSACCNFLREKTSSLSNAKP